jgi:hypothetical protein
LRVAVVAFDGGGRDQSHGQTLHAIFTKTVPHFAGINNRRAHRPILGAKLYPLPGDDMTTPQQMIRVAFALTLAVAACPETVRRAGGEGGEGGGEETGGSTGTGGSGTGGSAPEKKDAAAQAGSGGSGGGAAGTGGTVTASLDAGTDSSAGGAGGAGDGGAATGGTSGTGPGGSLGWYEAEAVPPNMLFGATKIGNCGAGACPSTDAIKEGMECCSAGKKLSQLLRGTGGAVLNEIAAPADGMYDVTWWFHCGKNDNFGDTGCGGLPHTPSGCRPHVFQINGTKIPGVYHFPCFPGSWGEIHASTTTLPLKAGMNSIRVVSTTGRDAADLDALQIFPAGKGLPPKIPPTAK